MLLFIKPHQFGIGAAGLSGFYISPAVSGNVPCTIDKGKRINCAAKTRPCGIVGGITVPVSGFLHCSVVDGVNGFIAVVFKTVWRKVGCNAGPIQCKTGNSPLSVCHGFNYQVFLNVFNRLFTAAKRKKESADNE